MKRALNIGSGQRPFKTTGDVAWVNIDSQAKWCPDLVGDGSCLNTFSDDAVDYVVLHHVLEHFGCGESASLIREAKRVLKPRGRLLVFVPDMQALAKRWLEGGLDTQIYMTNVYGAYMGDEADRHKWGFTFNSLYDFLKEQGPWFFQSSFGWEAIPGADIARDFWIIGMECQK